MNPLITKNTLVDYPRLEVIKEQLDKTRTLAGDVVEVGVYKGGTAVLITQNSFKHVYLFDTFNGMPPVNKFDLHKEGDFSDTSLRAVTSLLDLVGNNYSVYKGIFPTSNSEYVEFRRFSFVHLDVDIYSSIKECLTFFHTRMVPGGVILLDDYLEPHCPGAKLAADEFYSNKSQKVTPTVQSQAIIQY